MADVFDPSVQLQAQLLGIADQTFRRLKTTHDDVIRLVWHHPTLTPTQTLAALGSHGARLFMLAGILRDAINTAQPGAVDDSAMPAVTINQDGTVVLT